MNFQPLSRQAASVALLLTVLGSVAAHCAPASLPIKSTITGIPASVKPNQIINITLKVDEMGKSVPNATVDLEIQDSKGQKAVQKFWEHQTVVKNKPMTYTWSFNAPKSGTYHIYTGVFTASWKQMISFDLKTGILKVA